MLTDSFPRTLVEFEGRFATEEACREHLKQLRWPDGWQCPHCSHGKGWTTARHTVHCAKCGHQTSLTAGTVMHGTKKPLRFWFKAMYLITAAKNGVSAKTLQRELGISYPTAWSWLHKLRRAMARRDQGPLCGTIEADETYVGKDKSRRRGRHKGKKAIVVILVEDRGEAMGRARMATVPNVSGESLHRVIETNVAPGSTVRTDGWEGYRGLENKGYKHQVELISTAESRAEKAARAAEAFPHVHQLAGLLHRWLLGTHQGAVREKHLQAYLEEFVFRFNRRNSRYRTLLFERLASQAMNTKMEPYWQIIGREAPEKALHLVAA